MKIAISYPPLVSDKGVALLSQNRQFQWFKNPTYIYPVVPASAATLLKHNGYEIVWDDAIAEEISYENWLSRLAKCSPDIVAIETKTPVVKRHWKIIRDIKNLSDPPLVVLMGDHVTALPEESLLNSPVDYILLGGDYDFMLLKLIKWLEGKKQNTPPPGFFMRGSDNNIINTGSMELNHDLNTLPLIDRELSRWKLYAYKNGNFKYTPGTYVMAGRDCWWGKCSFCSWTSLYPSGSYRTVTVKRHVEEIGRLITDYPVREIFDDSGCFPAGKWLDDFCRKFIEKGYHKRVVMGCNMRCGALSQENWNLMKQANFRFVLIGLESIVQSTLDRLNKGITVTRIEETLVMAKKAGLEPHVTAMVGYPWETAEDAEKTVSFAKRLFAKGCINSLQATIVVPYPGTPLFEDAKSQGWLTTQDWDRFDMKHSVWKSPVGSDDVMLFTRELYKSALSPGFIFKRIISIRNVDDIVFLIRAAGKLFSKIADFKK